MKLDSVANSATFNMNFPLVHKDDLLLFNKSNAIAIACMWSLKEKIKETLTEESLSSINLIGNTYSINAPKAMIVNLSCNRSIRHIIITGDILCYQSIVNLLIEIFASDKITSCMQLYEKYLPDIRKQILTCQYVEINNLNKYIQCLVEKKQLYDMKFDTNTIKFFTNTEDIPLTLPCIDIKEEVMKVVPSEEYPSNISGYTVHCYDGDLFNSFLDICQVINTRGYVIGNTREISNLTVVCHSIDEESINNFPQLNSTIISQYKTDILNSKHSDNISYTYGSILFPQIGKIISMLYDNPLTRQCYIPIFENKHYAQPPCVVSVFFRIIKDKLNLTVTMRSNDMFKAWPCNVIAFRVFQNKICKVLNAASTDIIYYPGILTTIGYSAHIYNDDLINLKCLLKDYFKKTIIPEPEGYYIIDKPDDIDTIIQVKLFSNDHGLVKVWQNDSYELLIEEVSSYISNAQHAAYVAKEICRIHYTKNLIS